MGSSALDFARESGSSRWRRPRATGARQGESCGFRLVERASDSSLEIEHGVEPAMDADERRDASDREQRAVDVWSCARASVMADRQSLIRHAEDDLRADHKAWQADGVHLRAAE